MAVRFAFISTQTQQGRTELQLQPSFDPRNCYHCAGSTHYTRSTTDFSRIQLRGGFQDASGPDLRPLRVNGLYHGKGILWQAAHGGPGCGGAVETQGSSAFCQQLRAKGISCL